MCLLFCGLERIIMAALGTLVIALFVVLVALDGPE
jgi:hypothetical protein